MALSGLIHSGGVVLLCTAIPSPSQNELPARRSLAGQEFRLIIFVAPNACDRPTEPPTDPTLTLGAAIPWPKPPKPPVAPLSQPDDANPTPRPSPIIERPRSGTLTGPGPPTNLPLPKFHTTPRPRRSQPVCRCRCRSRSLEGSLRLRRLLLLFVRRRLLPRSPPNHHTHPDRSLRSSDPPILPSSGPPAMVFEPPDHT